MHARRVLVPALAIALLLTFAPSAVAARTVYFTDPEADEITQYSVGPGGTLTPLGEGSLDADDPFRPAMTSTGRDLYATAEDGVLQYDVAADGQLTAKTNPLAPTDGWLHSIAVHPDDGSVYVTDAYHGKVRQFDVGVDGELSAKDPAYVVAGSGARGVAVSPDGATVYVLVSGGIAVFDVGADGALTRRDERVDVPSYDLEDLALTPDSENLYATSGEGRVFQFGVTADGTPVAGSPASLDTPPGTRPRGIAVAPDGSAVYVAAGPGWSGSAHRQVIAYVVGPDGRLTPSGAAEAADPGERMRYLSASPDGKSLFAAGGDGHLFDLGPGGAVALKPIPTVDLDEAVGVVVSPNQAPIANFGVVGPGVAGAPVRFDASTAIDTDGDIVRYDWDFGDGSTLPNGGPTPEHVYTSPGSYTVTLVVTDNEGASTTTIFTGGTVLGRGSSAAQASQLIQILAAAQPLPQQQVLAADPRPNLGETVIAEPVSGAVRVRLPGTPAFVPLSNVREVPVGSTLDTRRGTVEVATERLRKGGRVQHGEFYGGLFSVHQRRRDRYITETVLRGSVGPCKSAQSSARRRRRLWSNANGRFRSRGRHSAGAVRGTRWLTIDRCDGTLTVVREGTVSVRDFKLKKRFLVDAGERYLARGR